MSKVEEIAALKPASWIGVRHLQALMIFLSMTLAFGMRVNMSLAIVSMTDASDENAFDWSPQIQSVILSSFFWGYVVLQIPGGVLTQRFGGKLLLTLCIGANSATLLLIPIAAHIGGWQLVCACRVIQGLFQGFLMPSGHCLIAKWVPLEEKSRLGTFIYSGAQLGVALQLIVSGFISQYLGWPAIFYINGALGAIWTVLYIFIGSTTPQTSKLISEQEKLYIETSLGHVDVPKKKLKTPWKSIFTSLPVYALIITQCGHNWGLWTLMTLMPSYMSQILGVDISANGVMSALPYLSMYLMSFPFSFASDYILKKQWLSITACRKISNTFGQWGPALFLVVLNFASSDNAMTAVLILCAVVGINAGYYTGYLLVHIDMAPNYGGTLMGIANCVAQFVSIFAPLIAGTILKDQGNPDQWKTVFFLAAFIYFAANTIFLIFGTSETQEWNETEDSREIVNGVTEENKSEKVV